MQEIETKSITAFDLWTYLNEIQSAILEGYRLDDSNANFPQGYVGLYTCGMTKVASSNKLEVLPKEDVSDNDTIVSENKTEDKPKVQRKVKVTRNLIDECLL